MNTHAIKIIQDEIDKECWAFQKLIVQKLEVIKDKLSFLPSIESKIEILQRYNPDTEYLTWEMDESDNWEYIRYDSLLELLKN